MPSEAFMQSVLNSESAAEARGEVEEEQLAPEIEPEEEASEYPDGQEDAEEDGQEQEADEPPEGDEEEAEEEPQGEAAYGSWEEEFDTPEAAYEAYQRAQKQERDNRAWGQEQSRARAALERELQEARELLAYTSGRAEMVEGQRPPATSAEFREWAEDNIEAGVPEKGMLEVQQYAEETGDWSYAKAYTDIWAEDDPYRAAKAATFVEMGEALHRSRAQEPEEEFYGQPYDVQQASAVIDQARTFLTQHYPDLQVGSPVLQGTVDVIKEDQRLHEMLRSGDFQNVTWAIEVARDRYLARVPRRARASKASRDAVDAEKTRLPAGDGVRVNGRRHVVSEEVPQEFQGAMDQFANWGMLREE